MKLSVRKLVKQVYSESGATSHLTSLKVGLIGIVLVLVIGSACGYAPIAQGPSSQTASPARTESPSPSPLPSGQWPMYNDATYKFSISYPPTFTFERQHGITGTDILMLYRAVDPAYANGYPPGEIDIGVYVRDADTVDAWVTKHSGPPTPSGKNLYWNGVTNRATVTVAGRDAIAFVWTPNTGKPTIYSSGVFLGATYVLIVSWWSMDPLYSDTVQRSHQHMLQDLRI
jgi:hypothetical protein